MSYVPQTRDEIDEFFGVDPEVCNGDMRTCPIHEKDGTVRVVGRTIACGTCGKMYPTLTAAEQEARNASRARLVANLRAATPRKD